MGKIALDKKFEWERIYEGLKDILDILTAMDEKHMMQSELVRMIETAKVQAKLWSNPPVKTLASGDKMANLKERASKIAKEAAATVAGYRRKQAAQQTVWVIVDESGALKFGQDQISSAPVYASQEDAQLDLDNFADEGMAGWKVVQATLNIISGAESMGGVYER
jgi:hypothetical protein